MSPSLAKAESSDEIIWPTQVQRRLPGGLCVGVDKSVWLVRSVPMGPVIDANSEQDALNAAIPLYSALGEIAEITRVGPVKRRRTAKGGYREVQILLVNIPRAFQPPRDHPNYAYMKDQFGSQIVLDRVLMLAIRLNDKLADFKGSGARIKEGFAGAIDRVAETIVSGQSPLSAYEQDRVIVSSALARAGLTVPTNEEFRVAEYWWTLGDYPDVPAASCADHMHFFDSPVAARAAANAGLDDCKKWPSTGSHTVTFASAAEFNLPFVPPVSGEAQWAAQLMNASALAISIRGRVEPGEVTMGELKRQSKRYMDDMVERANNNKATDITQEEMQADLSSLRDRYSGIGAPPVLTEASVLVAFDGYRDINNTRITPVVGLRAMSYRNERALSETMLCSPIRANPYLHDLPAEMIACSGIVSRTAVGDKGGLLLGFTELDRQPAWLDTMETGRLSLPPTMICAGGSGSGKTQLLLHMATQIARSGRPCVIFDPKALALDTVVPTPTGSTTMGELAVGDTVFGRDGAPCRVTSKSQVFEHPDLFAVHFSDGQVLHADGAHRWIVSTFQDRAADSRGQKFFTSNECRHAITVIDNLTNVSTDARLRTVTEVVNLIDNAGLDMGLSMQRVGQIVRSNGVAPVNTGKPARWDTQSVLKALRLHFEVEQERPGPGLTVTTTAQMHADGPRRDRASTRFAVPVANAIEGVEVNLGVPPYLLGVWLGDGSTNHKAITSGEVDLNDMVANLREEWSGSVDVAHDHDRTWRIDLNRNREMCLYGHSDYRARKRGGTDAESIYCATCARSGIVASDREVVNPSLHHLIKRVGVLGDKHIPLEYLRASVSQRLALLQGLMDTDGTVKRRGDLRLTLCNQQLANDALELIRSLGFKATFWSGPARITEPDPDNPGAKRSRVVGVEYVTTFRTSVPVFRLPRKLKAQPKTDSKRSRLNYITAIVPIESRPAQCIVVDSPDHSYLAGQFVVTHNSDSDHSPTVLGAGGIVRSLDDLVSADGAFDPIRFTIHDPRKIYDGLALASSTLSSINPWGSRREDYETDLRVSLSYGVDHGARCTGQALQIARDAGICPPEIADPVLKLARSDAMFRACVGLDPDADFDLRFEGLVLVKVGGANLELPDLDSKGSPSQGQRIGAALVRLIIFGSAAAVASRGGGAVCLDEAWIFLQSGLSELSRLARLARSQDVMPILFTQKITDALGADFEQHISRGLLLHMDSAAEARAACELFQMEPSEERISRFLARAERTAAGGTSENWDSFQALLGADGKAIRGAVGIYSDVRRRNVPVEIKLNDGFLRLSSTRPEDLRARDEAAQRASGQSATDMVKHPSGTVSTTPLPQASPGRPLPPLPPTR